ncbi:hypothetical protein D3C78_1373430 [compost metagenome]
MAFAVDDVGARGGVVPGLHQHPFDDVLHLLDIQARLCRQALQHGAGQVLRVPLAELAAGLPGCSDGAPDLAGIECDLEAIAFAQGYGKGMGGGHLASLHNMMCLLDVLPTRCCGI